MKGGKKTNVTNSSGPSIRQGAIIEVTWNAIKQYVLNDANLSQIFEGKNKEPNFWRCYRSRANRFVMD